MFKSFLCRHEHFYSDWYAMWLSRMGFPAPYTQHVHRKPWEWAVISGALFERGMLQRGRKGLGFAVGSEPLVSMFAGLGADVDATDLFAGATAEFWRDGEQYAVSKDALFRSDIIERDEFDRRVNFYNADMNDLSKFEPASYDFIWSSCAVEHVGSLEKATAFLSGAMDLLKPGGISVHTTEFNITSTDLFEDGYTVIFREDDIRALDRSLRLKRGCVEAMDFDPGSMPMDIDFDLPPYCQGPTAHIKLLYEGNIITSIALICRKAGAPHQ